MISLLKARTFNRYLKRIGESKIPIRQFFEKYRMPFSLAQFYRYKKRYEREGWDGLFDRRTLGNHRRLTDHAANFLLGYHAAHPNSTLMDYQVLLKNKLDIKVDLSTISRGLHAHQITMTKSKPSKDETKVETFESPCGGLEILSALAWHLKWPEYTAQQIQRTISPFVKKRDNPRTADLRGRNPRGRFTAAYNRRRDIRQNRFAAIADKRRRKDLSRLELGKSSSEVLARKALAILALPVITLNGTLRSANTPLGNALKDFSGYNYMQATLDKFLRELKYLGLAEILIRRQIPFWQKQWRALKGGSPNGHGPLLCYYIDGNTKALWSSQRVQKNKVMMLGRVMGCLEQVFVHDAFGRPTYFETHAGRAPWGEYVLSLFEKIEQRLQGPGPKLPVRRLLILDGANNSVKTIRAFAAQDKYYFITTLDKNQWQPRRIRCEGPRQRYDHGPAFVRECEIELKDSTAKSYLVVVRAIKIEWDDGAMTVLITNLPAKILRASRVVKSYFDRWPLQELWFRDTKEFAALHRVAGYGKKLLDDEKVREKQHKFQAQIVTLQDALQQPLAALAVLDQKYESWIEKERRLRAQTRIADGKRITTALQAAKLDGCRAAIAAIEREKRKVRQPYQKQFARLKRCEREWLRLQGKEKVYKVDVELDQIMTYFRVAFVNLCTYLQMKFFNKSGLAKALPPHITLATLLHRIFLLPATVEQTNELRRVYLKRNRKDKTTMALLERILPKLNQLNLRHASGRRLEFLFDRSHLNANKN
jgi:transposase